MEEFIWRLSIALTRNGSGMLDGGQSIGECKRNSPHFECIPLVYVTCTTSEFGSEYRTP
jgi:hypothetical protein